MVITAVILIKNVHLMLFIKQATKLRETQTSNQSQVDLHSTLHESIRTRNDAS